MAAHELAGGDHFSAGMAELFLLAFPIELRSVEATDAGLRDPVFEPKVLVAGTVSREGIASLLEDNQHAMSSRECPLSVQFQLKVRLEVGSDRDSKVDCLPVRRAEHPAIRRTGASVTEGASACRWPLSEGGERREVGLATWR